MAFLDWEKIRQKEKLLTKLQMLHFLGFLNSHNLIFLKKNHEIFYIWLQLVAQNIEGCLN
jgi:hypothetical protein